MRFIWFTVRFVCLYTVGYSVNVYHKILFNIQILRQQLIISCNKHTCTFQQNGWTFNLVFSLKCSLTTLLFRVYAINLVFEHRVTAHGQNSFDEQTVWLSAINSPFYLHHSHVLMFFHLFWLAFCINFNSFIRRALFFHSTALLSLKQYMNDIA